MRPIVVILAVLAVATPAAAQTAASERAATVGQLIGLGPAEVRARLSSAPAIWPVWPALEMAQPGGARVSFIQLASLLEDPALREHLERFIAGQAVGPLPPHLACQETIEPRQDDSPGAGDLWLMFRDGRLSGVLERGPATPRDPEYRGSVTDRPKSFEEMARMPVTSPYPETIGRLPLSDGLGFLKRWREQPTPAEARIEVHCVEQSEPGPPRPLDSDRLADYNPQGLIGLPFLPAMPFINAHRREAAARGAEAMAALRLGEPVPGGADGFVKAHAGVRVLRDEAADYAVLAVNVGSLAGNQLENTDQVALAGVREGRVAWLAPNAGWLSLTLCLDEKGIRRAVRLGCKGFPGRYVP